jgi:hypothetical protein
MCLSEQLLLLVLPALHQKAQPLLLLPLTQAALCLIGGADQHIQPLMPLCVRQVLLLLLLLLLSAPLSAPRGSLFTHPGYAVPAGASRRPTLSRDGSTGSAEPCSSSSSSSSSSIHLMREPSAGRQKIGAQVKMLLASLPYCNLQAVMQAES